MLAYLSPPHPPSSFFRSPLVTTQIPFPRDGNCVQLLFFAFFLVDFAFCIPGPSSPQEITRYEQLAPASRCVLFGGLVDKRLLQVFFSVPPVSFRVVFLIKNWPSHRRFFPISVPVEFHI